MIKTQNWFQPGAMMGVMAVLCIPASLAQTMPIDGSMGLAGGSGDYRILNNTVYDYTDLRIAHRLGYSSRQIATIAKIAWLTGMPFRYIRARVDAGQTFASLASEYGLRLSDVLDSSDEQARIEEYLRLYESLNSLGTMQMPALSTAQSIPGPTLAELEAQFNQINANFPALPPTNIETTPIGSAATAETTTVVQAPPIPVIPPPPPPAPRVSLPPPVRVPVVYRAPVRRTRVRKVRRRIVHKYVRRHHQHHRHLLPIYKRHMGS